MKSQTNKTKLISQKGYTPKNMALLLFVVVFLGGQIFLLRQNIYASVLEGQGIDTQTVDNIITQPVEIAPKVEQKPKFVLLDEAENNVWQSEQVLEITPQAKLENQENTNMPTPTTSSTQEVINKEEVSNLPNPALPTTEILPSVPSVPSLLPESLSDESEQTNSDLYVYSQKQSSLEYNKMLDGSEEKQLIGKIASQPQAMWFGDWYLDIEKSVNDFVISASQAEKLPVLVLYNIPKRDCFGYSGGGAGSDEAYKTWIDQVKTGVAGRKSMIILEPDAVAGSDCLSVEDRTIRYELIKYAVDQLASTQVAVYVDAGHSNWVGVQDMAERLRKSGIEKAKGFALNISNFYTNDSLTAYGRSLNEKLGGGETFVIDTSRNGNGPTKDFQWCNPRGRALGDLPTLNTGVSGVDAFLWIKAPGESDGTCNGGLKAGVWWLEYALELVRNSNL